MRRLRAAVAALTMAAVGLGGPAAALPGAPDTQPPSVEVDAFVHPRVGSQVLTAYDRSGRFENWQGNFFLKWQAEDGGSGICRQTVAWHGYEQLGGDNDPVLGRDTVVEEVGKNDRRYNLRNLNQFNHDRVADQFVVRARDCAGNPARSQIAGVVFGTREDRSSRISYDGGWKKVQSAHLSGGTARRASSKGASFTTTFRGGQIPIALVMSKGGNGGRADVIVDGDKLATVDTAGSQRHRIVVWQRLFPAGEHTLEVVNRPRPGHRWVTFDTLILGDGPGS